MVVETDSIRTFLDPAPKPPPRLPVPRRRFAGGLLFLCAVAATGGTAFIIHAGMSGHGHPVPKPGPRRYPPGYHHRAAKPPSESAPG